MVVEEAESILFLVKPKCIYWSVQVWMMMMIQIVVIMMNPHEDMEVMEKETKRR